MHCYRCGKLLTAASRFCNHCGADLSVMQAGKVPPMRESATPISQDGEIIFRVRPSLFSVSGSYLLAAFFSLVTAAAVGYFGGPLSFALVVVGCLFLLPVYRHLQRNLTAYTLTTSEFEINAGLFSRTAHHIPLRSIQNVFISATLAERLVGIGNVVIDSASEAGKIRMRRIRNPRKHADLILQQLHR